MKLRISDQMFRFRLTSADVAMLRSQSFIKSIISLPGKTGASFGVELRIQEAATTVQLEDGVLRVQLQGNPLNKSSLREVLFDEALYIDESQSLRILVEEDEGCRSHG